MGFHQEFGLLLRARYPLIYLPTQEEERAEQAVAQCASQLDNRMVYVWDFVEGYQGNPNDAGFGKRNPAQALEFIETINGAALFVLSLIHI